MLKLLKYIVLFYILQFLYVINSLFISAQEVSVPVKLQFEIFSKMLDFDRNFQSNNAETMYVYIIYQSGFRTSLNIYKEAAEQANNSFSNKFKSMFTIIVPIDIDNTKIESSINKNKRGIIYVSPLRGISIDEIIHISHNYKLLTFSGLADYIDNGLSVSVLDNGGKPKIIINLKSSLAEGARFNSDILKISKVIE